MALFDQARQCHEGSSGAGFAAIALGDGRIVDEMQDVPGPADYSDLSTRYVLIGVWSGGRMGFYGPVEIFLYDRATLKPAAHFVAAPDSPEDLSPYELSRINAQSVGVSDRWIYVAVRDVTYRYPLAGSVHPKRMDASLGTWLGAHQGDRLYFGDPTTLWAVDVSDSGTTATPISAALGPFTSMVLNGDRGYVLTRDRRLLTIDLGTNRAIAATSVPNCYLLLRVERESSREAAICELEPNGGEQQGAAQVIGL